MLHLKAALKFGFIGVIAGLLTLTTPLTIYAASGDESGSTCTPPPASDPRSRGPAGSASATFHYNCDSGMWENDHYVYDPISNVTTPKDVPLYTYNQASGQWDFTSWVYNAPSGQYVARTFSVSQPPAGAVTIGGPTPVTPATPNSNAAAGQTIATATNGTAMSVANGIAATAVSGDATVYDNTTAGNATSGDATAIANIMNLLQSSSSLNGGPVATFSQTINGDVTGDILLDPAKLNLIQPASSTADSGLQINNQTDASITNQINLAADSGDATVARNTTAGSATSGNATAVANIINVINSVISSGHSFVGTININGNLNGDILLPPDFVDQLLASNIPTTTINTAQLSGDSSSLATIANNQSITNNVSAVATSGQAIVAQNTTAGNATSGDASSNITVFNLTGSQIIGRNSLLVFVNVMGKWVGMIVNAPGATAAQLGGGITSDQPSAKSTINATANASITNTVKVSAQSGNANVTENTTAGNATTGAARAAVNLLNVADGSMSLSDWFGVLFINVFGSWNGSFGVDTAAGNAPAPEASNGSSSAPAVQVLRFVAHAGSRPQVISPDDNSLTNKVTVTDDDTANHPTATLGSTTQTPSQPTSVRQKENSRWLISTLGSSLVGAAFLAAEKRSKRRQKAATARVQHA